MPLRPRYRFVGLLLVSALFALPARDLWARHHRRSAPARRYACEAFVAKQPMVVARPGDTLWRLVGENTGKPWIWPQVWALNPTLANPHWLVAGQAISFVAQAKGRTQVSSFLPADVAADLGDDDSASAAVAAAPAAEPGSGDVAAAPALAAAPQQPDGAAPPAERAARRFAPDEPLLARDEARPYACAPAALFAEAEVATFGTLAGSSSEGLLWGLGDEVQIAWPNPRVATPGPYAVVRLSEVLPGTKRARASVRLATCTGVVAAPEGPSGGTVVMAREEIGLGQRLVPLARLAPLPAAAAASSGASRLSTCATVLSFEQRALTGNALHLVFLDRGTRDGLAVGSLLQQRSVGAKHSQLATLRVLAAEQEVATAALVTAPQELAVGEQFCSFAGAQPR